jgi:hypothetical protein
MAVFDLVEGWDNPHRRYSTLDYHRPSITKEHTRLNPTHHAATKRR